jgi:hypothetical protein
MTEAFAYGEKPTEIVIIGEIGKKAGGNLKAQMSILHSFFLISNTKTLQLNSRGVPTFRFHFAYFA